MSPLRRTLAVLTFVLATAAVPARAGLYTDIWYNAAESGWGVNVVQSDTTMFLTFFIFGGDNKPIWYVAILNKNGESYTGNLYLATGTYFAAPWNPADRGPQPPNPIGTASFEPNGLNVYQATLRYTVNGVGTTVKPIERQTLTTIALGGNYLGGQTGAYSGCANPGQNVSYGVTYTLQVVHAQSGQAIFNFAFGDGTTCAISGVLEQHGLVYRMPGASYVCTKSGSTILNGTATLYELKATSQGIEGRLASSNVGGQCAETAQFSAVLY